MNVMISVIDLSSTNFKRHSRLLDEDGYNNILIFPVFTILQGFVVWPFVDHVLWNFNIYVNSASDRDMYLFAWKSLSYEVVVIILLQN